MRLLLCILLVGMLVGCAGTEYQDGGGTMDVRSSAFEHEGEIPTRYSCDGDNINPPLEWETPNGTVTFALVVDDPDAPGGTFDHWVVYKIPGDVNAVSEDESPGTEGKNDFGKIGYGGPCPPSGTHRYYFKVYALDTDPELPEGATKKELIDAMEGHVIDKGTLMGKFSR